MSWGNARTLRKVISIAQKREAEGITVALSALELYEDGSHRISGDAILLHALPGVR